MTDAAARYGQPAGRSSATDDSYFAPLATARYLLLTTFKPKGTPVSAPVKGIVDGDQAYFRVRSRSGTARRLRHTDGVHVAPCSALGLWAYGPALDAAARRLAGEEASRVAGQLDLKYPVRRRFLARLLPRARHRRLAYYELLLRVVLAAEDAGHRLGADPCELSHIAHCRHARLTAPHLTRARRPRAAGSG